MKTVKNVATSWMNLGRMFTSVNIANELRLNGEWVSCTDVSKELHASIEELADDLSVAYTVANIEVKGGVMASLYHLKSANPEDYTDINAVLMTPAEFKSRHGRDPFPMDKKPAKAKAAKKAGKHGATIVKTLKKIFNFPKAG